MDNKKQNFRKKLNVIEANTPKKIEVGTLLKKPVVKVVVVLASLYGVLFISKFFLNECAQLIIASKKLRNARKL